MTTRRNVLKLAGTTAGGLLLSTPLVSARPDNQDSKRLTVLVAGAHPDDPETGVGGTILRFTEAGHDVVVVYLTRGEAGIAGASHSEAARIRTAEALKACELMKARSIFLGQVDGATTITSDWYEKMSAVLKNEKPDIILTHWPLDSHRDHRICSNLVYDAWLHAEKKAALYYFEVCTGTQTHNFAPTHYVDVSPVIQRKWDACYLHVSQKIRETYDADHAKMELFRGLEKNVAYAEAFVRHSQSPDVPLP